MLKEVQWYLGLYWLTQLREGRVCSLYLQMTLNWWKGCKVDWIPGGPNKSEQLIAGTNFKKMRVSLCTKTGEKWKMVLASQKRICLWITNYYVRMQYHTGGKRQTYWGVWTERWAACGVILLCLVVGAACQTEALTLLGSGLQKHRRPSRETEQKVSRNNNGSKNHCLQKTETFLTGIKTVLS